MFMSFLNAVPLPILVLLGFAIFGLYDYFKKLYTWDKKIEMFCNYKEKLVEFHNNVIENDHIDIELRRYLLENALKIKLDSIILMRIDHPRWRISTELIGIINDIVSVEYNFTETCRNFESMLTQNIGAFKNKYQETRSQIISPVSLVKNGAFLILKIIPIVNRMPTNIKNLFIKIFLFISVIETLLSLFNQKLLIEQIIEWISSNL